MIKINLLPREPKKLFFFNTSFIIGSTIFILSLAGMGGAYYYLLQQTKELERRTQIINNDILRLQPILKKIKNAEERKINIFSQLDSLKNIFSNRGQSALILDELSNIIPDNVWLTNIKDEGEKIIINGKAITKDSVDEMVKRLQKSVFISDVKLNFVIDNNIGNSTISAFEIVGMTKS
ncbi:PilN domain-containing protein [Candidatus Poribacteria bacterium]|nr:PilN domain-containing protein [Candidatus Poribacteria bacterium]